MASSRSRSSSLSSPGGTPRLIVGGPLDSAPGVPIVSAGKPAGKPARRPRLSRCAAGGSSTRRAQRLQHLLEVVEAPPVLVLAPPDLAVVLPPHERVGAGAVLAHVTDGEALGLHGPAADISELDLHVGAPAGRGVPEVAHPAAGPVQAGELPVAQQPPDVHR